MSGTMLDDCYRRLMSGTYDGQDIALKLNLIGKIQKERALNIIVERSMDRGACREAIDAIRISKPKKLAAGK